MSQKAWIATLSHDDPHDWDHFQMWADAFAANNEFLAFRFIFFVDQSKAPVDSKLPMVPDKCILVQFYTEGSYPVEILLDRNIRLYSKITYFPDLPMRYPRSPWGSEDVFKDWVSKYCLTLTSRNHVTDHIKVMIKAKDNDANK